MPKTQRAALASVKTLLYFLDTKFISARRYTLRNSTIIYTVTFFSFCFFLQHAKCKRKS